MYAIVNNAIVVGGIISRDQGDGEYWTGSGWGNVAWSMHRQEAAEYETIEEAQAEARACQIPRGYSIVELCDD